jgi:Spy/CpxP family protein refolding chaperone
MKQFHHSMGGIQSISPRAKEHFLMLDPAFYLFALRRVLPLFGLLLALCGSALAQMGAPPPDGPPPGEMQLSAQSGPSIDRQLKQLTQQLTLTSDQQTQVKLILTDQQKQIQALFTSAMGSDKSAQSEPPSPEAMQSLRAASKTIRQAGRTEITALLTDTQKTDSKACPRSKPALKPNRTMPCPRPTATVALPPMMGVAPVVVAPVVVAPADPLAYKSIQK